MPVYQGAYYSRQFQLTQNNNPVNITGWHLGCQIRVNVNDAVPLLTISSLPSPVANLVITDPANGYFLFELFEEQTDVLPVGTCVFDVMRIDLVSLGPVYLFGGRFSVAQPVTRFWDA